MNNTSIKYALYKSSTENIGDEIQNIAARRFLPRIDYYIDRDKVGEWKNKNKNETVKLIANGWYMREPFAWPPTDKTIEPLLLSMYIEPNGVGKELIKPKDIFLSDKSKKYLNNFGPVGARDVCSLKILKDGGVDAYFSGCLTLTLQRDSNIKKQDFILAVDISDKLYNFLQKKTKRRIIRMSPYGDFSIPEEDRFTIAEYFLFLYQSAHAVVTTRLHATLPSLALETPVLLVKQPGRYDPKRYAGLGDLSRNATETEYMKNYGLFDLDNPGKNPNDYRNIRKSLISKCSEFTGYDNDKTFLTINLAELAVNEHFVNVFADSFIKRLTAMLDDWKITDLIDNLNNAQMYINDIEKQIKETASKLNNEKEKNYNLENKYDELLADYNKIKNSSIYYILRKIKRRIR